MQRHGQSGVILEVAWVRVVLWVLVGLFALSVVRAGVSVWLLARERDKVAETLARAEARAEIRSRELAALDTEAGVEKALRSAFNIKKPDEQTVVILDPTPPAPASPKGVRAWWGQFIQWFTPKQ